MSRGRSGERAAEREARRRGMTVLERNLRAAAGEIDLLALDGDTIVVIEVKSRRTEKFGAPEEAVNREKRRHLIRAARSFLARKHLLERKRRYDIAAVRLSAEGHPLDVRWIEAAFDEGEYQ